MPLFKKVIIGLFSLIVLLIIAVSLVYNFFKVYPPLKEYSFNVEVATLKAAVDEVISGDTSIHSSGYTEFYYRDKWQARIQFGGSGYSYVFNIKKRDNFFNKGEKSEIGLIAVKDPATDKSIYRKNQGNVDLDACIEEFSSKFIRKIQKRIGGH